MPDSAAVSCVNKLIFLFMNTGSQKKKDCRKNKKIIKYDSLFHTDYKLNHLYMPVPYSVVISSYAAGHAKK